MATVAEEAIEELADEATAWCECYDSEGEAGPDDETLLVQAREMLPKLAYLLRLLLVAARGEK